MPDADDGPRPGRLRRTHDGYRHEAFFWDGDNQFVAGVEFVDMVQLGAIPARIIPAWRRYTDQRLGHPVRGIGEPIWHGREASELRIWVEHHSLVCEVREAGRITDPMVGRRPPASADEHGRGLWMANQLCDLVQVRSSKAGTTVRIHTWL